MPKTTWLRFLPTAARLASINHRRPDSHCRWRQVRSRSTTCDRPHPSAVQQRRDQRWRQPAVNDRDEWERTFNICWGGVYFTTRAFLPLLGAADEAHLVNTSSINGFWASVGPDTPYTAYSAAKFAVKGFTEALIADFRMNAPHIKVSVVMPGHIGTGIRVNSLKVQTNNDSDELDAVQIGQVRARLASMGRDPSAQSDGDIHAILAERARRFVTDAPASAAEAATIILDGVQADGLASWSVRTPT